MTNGKAPTRISHSWGALGERGATLLDIAATLCVFALLLLCSIPVMPRLLAMYHLRGATQQVFSEVQKARLSAVMENNRYRIAVTEGSSEFTVHDDENNDGIENDGSNALSVRSLVDDNPGVTLGADGIISFAPNGAALGPRHIVLTNGVGESSTVVVSAGGRVFIQ